MKQSKLGAWLAFAFGALYFLVPLIATFEFAMRIRRGQYTFDAFQIVLTDPRFQATFSYSTLDRARDDRGRHRCSWCRPPIGSACACRSCGRWSSSSRCFRSSSRPSCIVFGYLRMYNSSSLLPLTDTDLGTNILLTFGYATLALPYMYRSVDAGLQAIDIHSLTEAAENLGARWPTILFRIILPNIRVAVLSGALLTFAIVIGEFTIASLLNRPAFGPYLQLIGANRAYEPAALAIIAFAITWACMGLIQLFARQAPGAQAAPMMPQRGQRHVPRDQQPA